MKVVYTIPVRSGAVVQVPVRTADLPLGTTACKWNISEESHLEAVGLEFTGATIRYDDKGCISPKYPELEEEAYRVANYLANRVYIQTACDAFDPDHVFSEAPVISPENMDEESEIEAKPILKWKSAKTRFTIREMFEPESYAHGFKHSAAYGYYADALRVASDFQKFELLYKVVEYFFPKKKGSALVTAVSTHMTPHDATFTPALVGQLRDLRDRSTHPHANKGHINPQDIANVREVRAGLPQMRKLVELLLAYPTF